MADTVDNHKLIVSLEARMRSYEKAIERAQGQTNQRMKGIENALKRPQKEMDRVGEAASRMEARLSRMGGVLKSFAAGLVGGFVAGGIAGIVSQFAAVAKSIATIGDEAKRAGLSIEAFQEWKFVAEQNRIGVDSLVDGFKELSLRADEFISTGSGPAAEAFQRLGYGADELTRKLNDPSRLMLEIIDRLGQMDKAAQIRIADELFGGSGGERFVELLDQGEKRVRDTIGRAHELGIVMDQEVIEKAAELDRKFSEITATVGTGLKTAIVEAAGALQAFIATFEGMWQRYEQRRAAAEAGALAGSLAGTVPSGAPTIPEVRTTPKTDRLPKAAWTPPTPPPGGFGSGSGKSRDSAAASAEREAEAVRRLIAELEFEYSLIGMSEEQRRAAVASRKAGAAATDEERARVIALTEAIHDEQAAIDALKERQEALADAGDYAFGLIGDALGSIADKSATAEEAIKKLAVQLAIAAAQGALLGSGPLAGLFGGGLFGLGGGGADPWGGLRTASVLHDGGTAGVHGKSRLIPASAVRNAPRFHGGTKPNELVSVLERGEEVLRRDAAQRGAATVKGLMASAREGGGRTVVDVRVGVNEDGKLQAFVERTAGQAADVRVATYDRAVLPTRVNQISQDPRRR